MSKRRWFQLLLTMVVVVGTLVVPGVRSAQGAPGHAFHRVKEIQERHTAQLMGRAGVVGTAAGRNARGHNAVVVLLERPGISGVPQELDGVPVHTIVTGKIYALAPSTALARSRRPWWFRKDRTPPEAPTGLTATATSSSQIDLDWADNSESDLSYYGVYRATTSGGPYSRVAFVQDSEWANGGLASATTYYYVVRAVDTSGNLSSSSSEAEATTKEGPLPELWCQRPVPIGVSTGHFNISAGTIGCRVSKDGRVYALSNNHVYADENRASIGENVLQPGPYDGGVNPRDAIGTLAEFEPIVFSRLAKNTIDAALALCSTETLSNGTPDGSYGIPASTTAEATVALNVRKHGRASGLTSGEIYAVNATVDVTYDRGVARFVGQIVITPGSFTAAGDSGALVVTRDGNNPVGLVFAGSDSYTIANPIDLVLDRFGVTVDGQ